MYSHTRFLSGQWVTHFYIICILEYLDHTLCVCLSHILACIHTSTLTHCYYSHSPLMCIHTSTLTLEFTLTHIRYCWLAVDMSHKLPVISVSHIVCMCCSMSSTCMHTHTHTHAHTCTHTHAHAHPYTHLISDWLWTWVTSFLSTNKLSFWMVSNLPLLVQC